MAAIQIQPVIIASREQRLFRPGALGISRNDLLDGGKHFRFHFGRALHLRKRVDAFRIELRIRDLQGRKCISTAAQLHLNLREA